MRETVSIQEILYSPGEGFSGVSADCAASSGQANRGRRLAAVRESSADYQIPLSLPVIFCPMAATVARQGSKLSRAVLRSWPFSMRVVHSEA